MRTSLSENEYPDDPQVRNFYLQAVEEISAIAGIELAGATKNVIALAAGITFGLFWLMQFLISMKSGFYDESKRGRVIEFVRLKRESELELKKRMLPEKQERGNAALTLMAQHLADNDFFAAERYTIADIAL